MKYCSKCLQPNTRPNTKFSLGGICPSCEYFSKHEEVQWEDRTEILMELAERYRNKSAQYDCIIGVSGGKDSFRQALWVRDYLKLRPLLICLSYPPHQQSYVGAENLSALIEAGFDVITVCPAPLTWKKLMRVAFNKYANWCKATELALFAAVPQLAIDYKISCILWGENPGLQLGDLGTLGETGYDGNNLRGMNTLDGGDLEWMLNADFKEKDLIPFRYPTKKEFIEHDIQIIYLGWFLGDWSLLNNGSASALAGFSMRHDSVEDTGDLYGVSSLDEPWVTLNQMIKYYKFGFGRTSDYVNEMIRLGTITREEGIALCNKFDGACSDSYIDSFCEYIDITSDQFWKKVISVTNRDLFDVKPSNKERPIISKKFEVGTGVSK